MLYLLKHLLLLHLVNLKPKCNNSISTLIIVLYASYVCLLHFRFAENHPIDLEATNPSFLRWFYHNGAPLSHRTASRRPQVSHRPNTI
jgi:hypothetical protein